MWIPFTVSIFHNRNQHLSWKDSQDELNCVLYYHKGQILTAHFFWYSMCYKEKINNNEVTNNTWTKTIIVVHSLSCVWLFATPLTAAHQASLSFTISHSLLNLMSIELVIPSNHLILYHPLLLLSSIFPSIRIFSNELAVCIRWLKVLSFSISPSNEYSGWLPLRLTNLIPLQSKGFSRAFSNAAIQRHPFFSAQAALSHIHTWLPEKP